MKHNLQEREVKDGALDAQKLWRRRVGAGIGALLLCSPLAACANSESESQQAGIESCGLQAGIYSYVPTVNSERSDLLKDMLCSINDTPAGETIKISTYKLDDVEVGNALKNAHRRGVNIELYADASRGNSGTSRSLDAELNKDTSNESAATFCDGSCISPGTGVQHAKIMTFSHTKDVLVGSTNLSADNLRFASGTDFVIHDDSEAFDAANEYIDSFGSSPSAQSSRSSAANDSLSLTFAPYTNPQDEPISKLLQQVDCYKSDGSSTSIDVAVYDATWGRREVITRIGKLAQAGCSTSIVINGKNDRYKHERDQIAEYLRNHGANVVYPVAKGRMVHDKSLAINGAIAGKDTVATVISSGNFTKNAVDTNTEVTVVSNSMSDYKDTVDHLHRVAAYAATPAK